MNIGESVFYEKINIKKLNYILSNRSKYEDIIITQQKEMRKFDKNYNAFATPQKIKLNIIIPNELKDTDFGYLKITYNKGKNSNDIGRWYSNKGLGIQPLCNSIRHTICDELWTDIDQVNSHPTILKKIMDNCNLISPFLNEYILNREPYLSKIMKEEKCNRDNAKNMVISTINGKKYKSKILSNLATELKPSLNHIINLDEYKDTKKYVEQTYKDDKNISGKIISRILQVIENNLLETYIEFFNDKGLISKFNEGYEVALIFDGLQLRTNDKINDELLNECRLYALDKTGYDIQLKIKPFDNKLNLPETYNLNDLQILDTLIDKYKTGIKNWVYKYKSHIDICINSKGTHSSISELIKYILKDTIVYDETEKSWFYCNINNIWNKSKEPFILKGLLKSVFKELFIQVGISYNELITKCFDEAEKELLNSKIGSAYKIAFQLQNVGFIESISNMGKIDFNFSKFYENKIDSNHNLFAFNNKVFDCRTCEIRNIKPDDYIMINTGYDYPEFIDEDLKLIIENYYNTIYPNEDVKNYMWDMDALLIDGEKLFQKFVIHTGRGCNSKSTKFTILRSSFGAYFVQISAETFTKPARSANATNDLYKTKGTRLVIANEPNDDIDNKLQTNVLKLLVDNHKAKFTTRTLYKESEEISITFEVHLACNNLPCLSSVDGGIGRRIRNINYPVQFVDNPDPNNIHQALKNEEMCEILTTDAIRDCYIRLLLDRFINVSSKLRKEIIPQQILDDCLEYITDSNPVLGFITERYIITNNDKDRIKSSDLWAEFSSIHKDCKMTTSKFKTDVCNISGITSIRSNGIYFCGLKLKDNIDK
jgi:hypothetical protein